MPSDGGWGPGAEPLSSLSIDAIVRGFVIMTGAPGARPENKLGALLEYARSLSGARCASFFGIDRDGRDLVLEATTHGVPSGPATRFPRGQGLIGRAAAQERPYFCPDTETDPHFMRPPGPPPGTSSLLCLPILHSQGVRGVLNLTWSERKAPPSWNTLEHLKGTVSRFFHIRDTAPLPEGHASENPYESAERFQSFLLPRPDQTPELEIESLYRPLHPVGGDLLAVLPRESGTLLAIADVSGHDLGAALGMTMVRGLLRREASTPASLAEILENLDALLEQEFPPGWFASMFLAEVDLAAGLLRFSGAGHPPLLVQSPRREEITLLSSSACGLGLGLTEAEERTLAWDPGSTLLLYSDGLDAPLGGGQRAEEELAGLLDWGRDQSLSSLRGRLVSRLESTPDALSDDLSALLVRA